MKILHICLSCFYIDDFSYQENELVRQGISDGHEVEVIASHETFLPDGSLGYTILRRYAGNDGAMVERVPYLRWLPHAISKKLRIHPGTYERIARFNPNVILFHGACGWEIRTAARYARAHPEVKLYVDSHEDFFNSARGWVSKWLLHYSYYRPILRSSLDVIAKVLPVSISCMDFMRDFYGVPSEKLEFYPLGGLVPDDESYAAARSATRAELGIGEADVLIVQSGKIDATKKLIEALEAFSRVEDPALHFVVPGLVKADVADRVTELVAKDPRIRLLGWKTADELRSILCAADVYCQPGTQSATMQMSVACRCAIILDEIPSHMPYLNGNGWLIGKEASLHEAINAVAGNKPALATMQQASLKLALRILDCRLLANRILQ